MCAYLRIKFHVSKIILTCFSQGVILPHPNLKKDTWKAHPQICEQI